MLGTLFYTTTAILTISVFVFECFVILLGRTFRERLFVMRRRSLMAFLFLLSLHCGALFGMFDGYHVEIIPTPAIILLYFTCTVFTIMSSAYFGRRYYRNIFVWFSLLQYAFFLFFFHLVMISIGYYHRLYNYQQLLNCDDSARMYFFARIIWISILVSGFILLLALFIDGYIFYRHRKHEVPLSTDKDLRRRERINILIWAGVLFIRMITLMQPWAIVHILFNIVMIGIVIETFLIHLRFYAYERHQYAEQNSFVIIRDRLYHLMTVEENNPVYTVNVSIEQISAALSVDKEDFSYYLYHQLHTTFPAWVSEQRLIKCASELTSSERKISAIAEAYGYSSVAAMSKAFRKRFEVSPSEYRERNQKRFIERYLDSSKILLI